MSALSRLFARFSGLFKRSAPVATRDTARKSDSRSGRSSRSRSAGSSGSANGTSASGSSQPRRNLMGKATIQALPTFQGFEIDDIEVVQGEQAVAEACAVLRAAGTLGFDTESRPTFKKGEAPQGPHLVQLCTNQRAYLFPLRITMPAALRELLADRSIRKVGFDLRSDLALLDANFGLRCGGVEDLVPLFRRAGYRNTVGAVQAVAILFRQHYRKSKSAKMSNWAAAQLNDSQQRYAANDAYVALRAYQALRERARRPAATEAVADSAVNK
ncbi:3'-5' exonuclease [Chitinimonas sp.]|uniref:3'-5' exonuclease n=1 Tax=Chitinimonas sp. TaxID=1934313 RepID=UPI0035B02DA8